MTIIYNEKKNKLLDVIEKPKSKILLVLRGHIRETFSNNRLQTFLELLDNYINYDIYIQSWNYNEAQKNMSWRELDDNRILINKEYILNKFSNKIKHKIKKIIILEDDNSIISNLNGDINGKIGGTSKLGWKKMWFGINEIYKDINELEYNITISMRFDLFVDRLIKTVPKQYNYINNYFNYDNFIKILDLKLLIKNKINFLNDYLNMSVKWCIDNYIVGYTKYIKTITKEFNENLDNILYKYPENYHQEYYVKLVATDIIKNDIYDYLIIGSGLSGCVIAERISTILKKKVLIIDKREHIGGNCYDYIDKETNILVNKYGAHLFHTNSEEVWEYVNNFAKFIRWEHKVLSYVNNKFVSIPVNITTVNELCDTNIQSNKEMEEWLSNNIEEYNNITNSEEIAKSRIGTKLYNFLIKDYTYKQWNKYPNELDKSVLSRIPIRKDFDTRYFNDKYQGLPECGYTGFIKKILNNDLISLRLDCDYFKFIKYNDINNFTSLDYKIIYTGPIDAYFSNKGLPKLEYRSINFEKEVYNMNYYQPNSVVNYPSLEYPFTRIVEYKHFLNQSSDKTIIFKETTCDTGEPYYPVPNKKNLDLYEKYKHLSEKEKNVLFVGRLANYKYFNMDQAILNALSIFKNEFKKYN
jgi:UDP-galactopyranose mutase